MYIVIGNLIAKEAPDEIPNMYLGFWVRPASCVNRTIRSRADAWSSAHRWNDKQADRQQTQEQEGLTLRDWQRQHHSTRPDTRLTEL
jgi:hypothetical protein